MLHSSPIHEYSTQKIKKYKQKKYFSKNEKNEKKVYPEKKYYNRKKTFIIKTPFKYFITPD